MLSAAICAVLNWQVKHLHCVKSAAAHSQVGFLSVNTLFFVCVEAALTQETGQVCTKINKVLGLNSPKHHVDQDIEQHTLNGSLPQQHGLEVGQHRLVGPQSGLQGGFDSAHLGVSLRGAGATAQTDSGPRTRTGRSVWGLQSRGVIHVCVNRGWSEPEHGDRGGWGGSGAPQLHSATSRSTHIPG